MLFRLEKRRLRRDLISVHTHLRGGCQEEGARHFSGVSGDRMRHNGYKLEHRELHCNTKRNFLTAKRDAPLAEAAQQGCGVSSRDSGDSSEFIPCDLSQVTLLLQGVIERGSLCWWSLLFYDSMNALSAWGC